MTPRVTGRRAPASMRGRRAAAHLAAEVSMRASSSRVASRGELLARRLGVAAPGPRRDLTPGRIEHDRVRSSRDASTSPREWSIVSRGVPTVGFAASAIVARSGREERTARRSARGFAVHRSLRQHLGVGAPRDPVGEAALAEDVRAVRVRGVAVLHEVAAYLARELAHDALVGEHVRDWETHRPTPRSSTRERGAPRRQLLPLPSKREIARCEPRLGSVREGGLAGNGKKRKKNVTWIAYIAPALTPITARAGATIVLVLTRRKGANREIYRSSNQEKKSRLVDATRPHTS